MYTKCNLEAIASLAALITGLGKYWQVMQRVMKNFKSWQSVGTAKGCKSSKVEGKYLRLCYPGKQSLRQTALATWRAFLYLVLQEHYTWIVTPQASPFGQHRCILLTNLWSTPELRPSLSSPQGIFHEDTGRDERRCQDKKDTWCGGLWYLFLILCHLVPVRTWSWVFVKFIATVSTWL